MSAKNLLIMASKTGSMHFDSILLEVDNPDEIKREARTLEENLRENEWDPWHYKSHTTWHWDSDYRFETAEELMESITEEGAQLEHMSTVPGLRREDRSEPTEEEKRKSVELAEERGTQFNTVEMNPISVSIQSPDTHLEVFNETENALRQAGYEIEMYGSTGQLKRNNMEELLYGVEENPIGVTLFLGNSDIEELRLDPQLNYRDGEYSLRIEGYYVQEEDISGEKVGELGEDIIETVQKADFPIKDNYNLG